MGYNVHTLQYLKISHSQSHEIENCTVNFKSWIKLETSNRNKELEHLLPLPVKIAKIYKFPLKLFYRKWTEM